MNTYAVTIELPETLYEHFRQLAEWSGRSLEAELLDALAFSASIKMEASPTLKELLLAETARAEIPVPPRHR